MSARRRSSVAVLLASGVVACGCGDDPGPGAAAHPPGGVAPELKALLPVFSGPRTVDDDLPLGANSVALMESDAQPGERPDLSRRVLVSRTAGPVYVWPMRSGVCYAYRGGAGCGDLRTLVTEGVIWNARSDGELGERVRIGVVAHPSVRGLRVLRRGAPPVGLRLRDGVSVTDIQAARALRWRLGGRIHRVRFFPSREELGA